MLEKLFPYSLNIEFLDISKTTLKKLVKKLKNNKSNTDEIITGKAFWEVNLINFTRKTVSSAIYSCGYFEENLTRG